MKKIIFILLTIMFSFAFTETVYGKKFKRGKNSNLTIKKRN